MCGMAAGIRIVSDARGTTSVHERRVQCAAPTSREMLPACFNRRPHDPHMSVPFGDRDRRYTVRYLFARHTVINPFASLVRMSVHAEITSQWQAVISGEPETIKMRTRGKFSDRVQPCSWMKWFRGGTENSPIIVVKSCTLTTRTTRETLDRRQHLPDKH